MSILSEKAVIRPVSAFGSPAIVSICGRYTAKSRRNTFFLPRMKPAENIIARNAVSFGNRTKRYGTAVKLSFSESQRMTDTTVRNRAFTARKASRGLSLSPVSPYAAVPKNTAGASARSPAAFVHNAAEMLRLKVHFLSSIREKASQRFCGSSEVIPYRRYAAAYISGAVVSSRRSVLAAVTASCMGSSPPKRRIGSISPKYSSILYTAASAKRKKSSAPRGRIHIIIVRARLPLSKPREKRISSRIFISAPPKNGFADIMGRYLKIIHIIRYKLLALISIRRQLRQAFRKDSSPVSRMPENSATSGRSLSAQSPCRSHSRVSLDRTLEARSS